MNRTCIVYASIHHGNTKKVVSAIAPALNAQAFDVLRDDLPDFSNFDAVIFASGIYFGTVHKRLAEAIDRVSLAGKKVVLLYTCGLRFQDYARATRKQLAEKRVAAFADVHCRGYDTYGPLAKIGGIARKHPSESDIQRVLREIRSHLD